MEGFAIFININTGWLDYVVVVSIVTGNTLFVLKIVLFAAKGSNFNVFFNCDWICDWSSIWVCVRGRKGSIVVVYGDSIVFYDYNAISLIDLISIDTSVTITIEFVKCLAERTCSSTNRSSRLIRKVIRIFTLYTQSSRI